jgi:molybdenum cofactor biosynthesis protein B
METIEEHRHEDPDHHHHRHRNPTPPTSSSSQSADVHKLGSPQKLRVAAFTVSTSRYRNRELTDDSGEIVVELCTKAGHDVRKKIVDDDKAMIRRELFRALDEGYDSAIFVGGTGLSPRDVTVEAIAPLLDKEMEGFGEIFRRLSYDSIGSPAMMTRTLAGTIGGTIVFCLPGSPNAARLGVDLLLKELPHAVFIARSKP